MNGSIGIYISQFQIESLKAGNTFTTCEPKTRLDKIAPSLIQSRLKSIGQTYDAADENGNVQMKVKLKDCFMTTFGAPDSKFVAGLGFGQNTEACKSEYEKFWKANFPDENLNEVTELFVTIWEPPQ